MFTQETIKYLSGVLGITEEEFVANNAAEKEVKITLPKNRIILEKDIPTTKIFTSEEMAEYDKNIKAPEYGRGVDDGKKNSTEVLIKEINRTESLGLTGAQLNEAEMLAALKNKFGSKNEALIQKFEEDKKTLLGNAEMTEKTLKSELDSMQSVLDKMSIRNSLNNSFKGELTIDKDDALEIFMNRLENKKDEAGKEFVYLNGVKQQDQQLNAVPITDVWNNFIVEKQWDKAGTGRGGGNEHGNGTGATNLYQAFVKEMAAKNVNPASAQYQDALNAKMEDKDFKDSVSSD